MDVIELLRTIALTTAVVATGGALGAAVVAGQHGTPTASRVAMTGTAAVYMTIANNGADGDRLLGGETDVAQAVEVHDMADADGMMQMRPLSEGLEIPGGGEVVLEPGGLHVMLFGLTRDLPNGETYELTLAFERAGEVTLEVPVRTRVGAEAAAVTVGDLSISGVFTRPAPMIGDAAAMHGGMHATPAATPAR
jgi:copper(I)-binding protein